MGTYKAGLARYANSYHKIIKFFKYEKELEMKVFADKGKFQEKLLHAFHIQTVGVMGVVVFYTGDFLTAFHKELS